MFELGVLNVLSPQSRKARLRPIAQTYPSTPRQIGETASVQCPLRKTLTANLLRGGDADCIRSVFSLFVAWSGGIQGSIHDLSQRENTM